MTKSAEDILAHYGLPTDLDANAFLGDDDQNTAKQYGVKGMKWGVRKDDSGKSSVTKGPGDKAAKDLHPTELRKSVYKSAKGKVAKNLNALNNSAKYKGKSVKSGPLKKEYQKDLEAAIRDGMISGIKSAHVKRILKNVAIGVITIGAAQTIIGLGTASLLLHEEETLNLYLTPVWDDDGFLVDLELTEDDLKHYGIPGMRWGRRKQPDGSYKAIGRKKEKAPSQLSKAKGMSDDDLKAAVKRLQLERQFADLTKQSVSPGQAFIKKTLADAGKKAVTTYVDQAASKALQKGMLTISAQLAKQAKKAG